jgi:glycosyltransferase involved in cell wall biosynthesis
VTVRTKLKDALPTARSLVAKHALAGRKVVLYVGRLATVKRLDRLLDAFADVRRHQSAATLVLVGEGPERAALEAQASRLGLSSAVIFAGHVEGEELSAWYGCGSILALTSESETWGAVVNEALIAGLPVVCTDQAGARVLIDGSNGEVVDAANPRRLGAALAACLRRTAPIGEAQLADVRPSLMTQSFADAVRGFSSAVTSAFDATGSYMSTRARPRRERATAG